MALIQFNAISESELIRCNVCNVILSTGPQRPAACPLCELRAHLPVVNSTAKRVAEDRERARSRPGKVEEEV